MHSEQGQEEKGVKMGSRDSKDNRSAEQSSETQKLAQQTDIKRPETWSAFKKWRNVFLISLFTFIAGIDSTNLAVGSLALAQSFNLTDVYSPLLPVALYLFGLGVGPLALVPLSELYGRRIVGLAAFFAFIFFNVGSANAPNIAALCGLRFLAGLAASVGWALGPSMIAALFAPQARRAAEAAFGVAVFGGPIFGGIIAGFTINGTGGWGWLIHPMAASSGATFLLSLVFLDETAESVLLRRRARRQWKARGPAAPVKYMLRFMSQALSMPIRSPTRAIISFYSALTFGILYLHFLTLPLLFYPDLEIPVQEVAEYGSALHQPYSYAWPVATTGLSFLGAGLGFAAGGIPLLLLRPRSAPASPEHTLPLVLVGAALAPAGLTMHAWTAHFLVPWPATLLGSALFAAGAIMIIIRSEGYLEASVDGNGIGPDALGAARVVGALARGFLGLLFSIVAWVIVVRLGFGWGYMLLAFLMLAAAALPLTLRLRGRY